MGVETGDSGKTGACPLVLCACSVLRFLECAGIWWKRKQAPGSPVPGVWGECGEALLGDREASGESAWCEEAGVTLNGFDEGLGDGECE